MAALGELDGVAEQVGEDLPDASRVADHPVGHVRRDAQHHVQPLLLRGDAEQSPPTPPAPARRSKGSGSSIELAGLDLGEVEDVVDHREQRLGRAAHRLRVLALLRVQMGVEQEAGHADDAVHRRADLVAHVGEELALRLGARLRRFLGDAKLLRRAVPRRQLGAKLPVRLAQRGDHALEGMSEGVARASRAHLHREVLGGDGVGHAHVVAEELEEAIEGPAHRADLVAARIVPEVHGEIAPGGRGGEAGRVRERPHQVARDHLGGDGSADAEERHQHHGAPHRQLRGAAHLGEGLGLLQIGGGFHAVDQLHLLRALGKVIAQVQLLGLVALPLGGEGHDLLFQAVEDVHVHPLGGEDPAGHLRRRNRLDLRHVAGEVVVGVQLAVVLAHVLRVEHEAAHAVAHHHQVEAELQRIELEDVVDGDDLLDAAYVVDRERDQRGAEKGGGEEQSEEGEQQLAMDGHVRAASRESASSSLSSSRSRRG